MLSNALCSTEGLAGITLGLEISVGYDVEAYPHAAAVSCVLQFQQFWCFWMLPHAPDDFVKFSLLSASRSLVVFLWSVAVRMFAISIAVVLTLSLLLAAFR